MPTFVKEIRTQGITALFINTLNNNIMVTIKTKDVTIKGINLSFVVTARAQQFVNLDGSKTWGKTSFSACIAETKEGVTPAKCTKEHLLRQLTIIDNNYHLFT